jgi:hypothetical protein
MDDLIYKRYVARHEGSDFGLVGSAVASCGVCCCLDSSYS